MEDASLRINSDSEDNSSSTDIFCLEEQRTRERKEMGLLGALGSVTRKGKMT